MSIPSLAKCALASARAAADSSAVVHSDGFEAGVRKLDQLWFLVEVHSQTGDIRLESGKHRLRLLEVGALLRGGGTGIDDVVLRWMLPAPDYEPHSDPFALGARVSTVEGFSVLV